MSANRGSMARYPASETLLDEAVDATGLSDFGPGDFREGLDVLLESLLRDADLDPSTDADVLDALRRRLRNRLHVEEWIRTHPEVEQLEVAGPVDIHGLPRTGTTALANMLSLDPQFRSLRQWEQITPCPPPTTDGEQTDPRRLQLAAENEALPAELRAMHLYDVDATVEDTELLGMAFHGQQYTLPVWGYHAWWRGADLTATYAYHRRVIQLLQSRRPPNAWLFKAPHHKFHLDAFAAAYPEARFVMTHRDPAKAVPSYASLVSTIFPAGRRGRDPRQVGAEVAEHLRIGLRNAMDARARIGDDRFIDVHHRELVADPLGTVHRIYAFLDLELLPTVEQQIRAWQEVNRSGSHGEHRYTAEQFGLRPDQLRSDYDFYLRHFDVAIEA